jgi:hypothetical protein
VEGREIGSGEGEGKKIGAGSSLRKRTLKDIFLTKKKSVIGCEIFVPFKIK